MFGGMGPNQTGKTYDQFMYAAMLSRARIEQAWSGQAAEAAVQEEAPPQPEAAAFDPDMLKKLAQKAADGESLQEPPSLASAPFSSASMPTSAPSMTMSTASENSRFAGFSKEVIEAARAFQHPAQPTPSSGSSQPPPSIGSGTANAVPAAFRRRPPPSAEAGAPGVPLAFMKKKSSLPTVTSQPQVKAWSTGGDEARDPPSLPSPETFQRPAAREHDGEAAQKSEAAEAVRNIVSLRLEQAHKTVEANKAFHAVAPEPRTVEPKSRRRAGWSADGANSLDESRADGAGRECEDSERDDRDRAGSGAKQSGNSGMNLSQRELSALARGEPNPDAPVLGELRAPQNKGSSTDDKFNKTGAQEAREKRHRAMGHYRDRSRSRDRRRRRRSPSSSPERAGKRLFTATPSYRLTGSTFSSAPQKPAAEPRPEPRPQAPPSQAPPPQFSSQELPDWLKDIAEPAAIVPVQPKLGKKYLHMPRMMVEVLTHNGGEGVRDCEKKSQCQIRVETMIEEPVGIVSVNGNVVLGEQVLKEMLANKGLDMPPQDGLVLPYAPANAGRQLDQQQDIQIPDSLVRHFVGSRGCNMKALHAELDRRHGGARTVSIQILPSVLPGGFRRIQITGANRVEARKLVLQHIEDLKKQHLTLTPSNDPNMHVGPQQYYPAPSAPSGVSI